MAKDRLPVWAAPGGFASRFDPAGGSHKEGYVFRGDGGARLSREVNGADWILSEGTNFRGIEIAAKDELLVVQNPSPMIWMEYTREFGSLVRVTVSVLDLVLALGAKKILPAGDLTVVSDLKEMRIDHGLSVSFATGEPTLFKSKLDGGKVDVEAIAGFLPPDIGFIPGQPQYRWGSDFGCLGFQVGATVYSDRIEFSYGAELVYTVVRETGVIGSLDEVTKRRLPTDTELLEFMEVVFPEVE